jgi:hypothetical protein
MPHTITEFDESSAFERLVLERLCPVYSSDLLMEIDLRPAMLGSGGVQNKSCSGVSISASALEEQKKDVMPLLFGAAWKVLDLVIELALNLAPLKPNKKNGEWGIEEKGKNAIKGKYSILCSDQVLWTALCAAYVATTEHRHCLVHRLAEFSGSPSRLSGKNKQGVALRALETSELNAFVSVAQIVASAVISGGLDSRGEAHLRYELDILRAHTMASPLGGSKASKPTVVRMTSEPFEANKLMVDFLMAHNTATQRMPFGKFDLFIDVPDGSSRVLFAKLEDTPLRKLEIDLNKLPDFLHFR